MHKYIYQFKINLSVPIVPVVPCSPCSNSGPLRSGAPVDTMSGIFSYDALLTMRSPEMLGMVMG